jgi:hypothetical protein
MPCRASAMAASRKESVSMVASGKPYQIAGIAMIAKIATIAKIAKS